MTQSEFAPRIAALRHRPFARGWVWLCLIILLGAGARLYQLDRLPPGFYTDEAYYALDALDVIAGARPIYFPANNGREPLFIYGLSISISVLGRTPFAVRLPAALLGTLTIPAAYALGRALFNRRVGLIMAALTAASLWAIALSRIGLRASTLPPLAAVMLACLVTGLRQRRLWLMALSGALCGLCFYTYLSARLTPLPLIASGIFWYSAERLTGQRPTIAWRALAAFGLCAAVVAAPLALYAARAPQVYLGRAEQVFIFGGEDGWRALFDNLVAVLGMFNWRGDLNARHNLPGRPAFDPLIGLAFVAGLAWSAYRVWKRREAASALALLWSGTMLLPTLLTRDAPHFLRAIGALPMVFVFPALALDWVWKRTGRWGGAVAFAVLALSGALTAWDYFGVCAHDPNTRYAFQTAAVELAQEAKAYLADERRALYLDRRLWDSFPAVRFLLPESPALHVVAPSEPLAPPAVAETRVVIWPYGEAGPALNVLPPDSVIEPRWGGLFRNDNESEPYPLYATYTARPKPVGLMPVAEFEGGLVLRSAQVWREAAGYRVELIWSAEAPVEDDLHAFIHVRDADEIIIAQADGPLGSALYPLSQWRAGDWVSVAETLTVAHGGVPARLLVGLYRFPSGDRLRTADGARDEIDLRLPQP